MGRAGASDASRANRESTTTRSRRSFDWALKVRHPFDLGAPIADAQGKRTRNLGLRTALSYSRKGYSEAVLRQDTETFLRVLENALRSAVSAGCAAHGNAVATRVLKPASLQRGMPSTPHGNAVSEHLSNRLANGRTNDRCRYFAP
jgi:hypothetical protein